LKSPTEGVGISTYFKNGIYLGFSESRSIRADKPLAAVSAGVLQDMGSEDKGLKYCLGLSFGYINRHKIGGINIALIKCFFLERNFPFSLSFGFSLERELSKKTDSFTEMFPSMGISYTQAFFAKSKVYPVIGISKIKGLTQSEINDMIINIAINIRWGKDSDE